MAPLDQYQPKNLDRYRMARSARVPGSQEGVRTLVTILHLGSRQPQGLVIEFPHYPYTS